MSGSIALDRVNGGPSEGATGGVPMTGVPITGDAISGGGANRSTEDVGSSRGVFRKPESSLGAGLAAVGAAGGGDGGGGANVRAGGGAGGGGTSGSPLGIDGLNVGSSTSM